MATKQNKLNCYHEIHNVSGTKIGVDQGVCRQEKYCHNGREHVGNHRFNPINFSHDVVKAKDGSGWGLRGSSDGVSILQVLVVIFIHIFRYKTEPGTAHWRCIRGFPETSCEITVPISGFGVWQT